MTQTGNDAANLQLLHAAKAGDLPRVREALEDGARINKTDHEGNTALLIAAKRGDTQMFAFLVERGAAIDFINEEGNDALMLAIAARQEKVAAMCLSLPFNLAAANQSGKTAFLLAAEKNMPHVMTALEKKGADPLARDGTGATALMLAAENEGLPKAFVRLLRRSKVDLEAKDNNGRTVLMRQLNQGAVRKVEALLKAGADVSQIDHRQQSVQDIARQWGLQDLVKDAFGRYDVKRLTEGSGQPVVLLKKIQLHHLKKYKPK